MEKKLHLQYVRDLFSRGLIYLGLDSKSTSSSRVETERLKSFKKRQYLAYVKFAVFVEALFFIFSTNTVFAQVSYTPVRNTAITFSSIATTGTSFASWRNGTSTDDNLSASTAIGFNFNYDGVVQTTFSASTNGFITFNTGTTAVGSGTGAYGYSNSAFSASTFNSTLSLAPLYDDLVCVGNLSTAASLASSIKYKLTGAAPNRILTVEWVGMEVYANAGPNLNFQVKLYETSNKIEFWYGTMTASTAAYSYTLGLNAGTIAAPPTTTQLLTQQTQNTATFSNVASDILASIPVGVTNIIFTPNACAAQPTSLSATSVTSTSATINWLGTTPTPTSGYQYYVSTSATTPASTTSPTGSVAAAILLVNLTGLTSNTTYYYWVRSNCGSSQSAWAGAGSFITTCNSSTVNTSLSAIENFNTTSASAGCWRVQGSGLTYVTSGTNPVSAPQEGDRMVTFNSYSLSAGSQTRLISMPLNTSGTTGLAVDFYWLNENSITWTLPTYNDGVQIQYSTDGGVTWVNSGSFIPRQDATLASGAIQWNPKSVEIGAAAVGSNVLVGFLFTSQFGDNCFLDNVKIRQAKPVISSFAPASICVGSTVSITGLHFLNTTTVQFNGINATSFSVVSSTQINAIVPAGITTGLISVTTLMGGTATSASSLTTNPLPIVTAATSSSNVCAGTAVTLTGGGASTYTWTGGITNGVAFTPASSGTYTVTGASAAGCISTATVAVTVNPLPIITCPVNIVVNAATGSCSTVVTYAATSSSIPAPTITYSPVSGSVFSVGTTTVTATATTAAGCTSSCTFTVTVNSSGTSNWLGSVNTDWFNAGNWCGGIPTAITDVFISSSTPFMPTIAASGAVAKNITINSGGSLTMNANSILTLGGNWTNNGTFTATGGTVNFNGTVAQSLSGATTFSNVTLNNTAGLLINSNVNVSGVCQLVSGMLTTNLNVLQITNGASLVAVAGYVNGNLKKYINASSSFGFFEIGSSNGYTPLNIYFNAVTAPGYLTVNTVSTDHPSILSSGLNPLTTVNRYWNLLGSGLTFDFYSVDLSYLNIDKDAGFNSIYAGAKIISGSTWNVTSPNYSGTNSFTITDVTSFGAIQIGVFNPTPFAFSILPNYGYVGLTSNVVITGKGFISGASTVNAVSGVTINSTTVNTDSTMTLNISINPTAISGIRKLAVTNLTNAIGYGGGTSDTLTFTIRKKPVVSFFANATSIVCNTSGSVEFTNYSTDGESYKWDFGAGASPATAIGTGPYTVTYSTTGLKTVKLVAYSPIGNDSLTRVNYINVTATAPVAATSISGPVNLVCSSSAVSGVYTVPLKSDVYYNWTVPPGATITSGVGTRTIIVSFSGAFVSGTISVTETNACGTSAAKTISVTKGPATPSAISGSTILCGLTSATYTVAAVAGALSYTWTLPAGVTCSSGLSPITTTGTSITVNFSSTFISGTISVKANNSCTSGFPKTLAISRAPATPASISGTTLICGLTSSTYTVSATAGATSYTWILPSGITSSLGTSPVTTLGTTLTVNISATFSSGSISVKANNECSSSALRSLALKLTPNTPGAISGPSNICSLTSATYSIAPVAGSTCYTWTLPAGVIPALGASSVTTSTPSISVIITSGVGSGTISVVSNNACGVSGVQSKVLTGCHSFSSAAADSTSQNSFEIKIYPNPTSEKFNVEFVANTNSQALFEIYDLNGNRIQSKKETVVEGNNILEGNIEGLSKGIYFIKLIDELNQLLITKKLVVQ